MIIYRLGLISIFPIAIMSCSTNTLGPQTSNKISLSDKSTIQQINKDNSNINILVSDKKGGVVSGQLNLNSFSTKVNTNGSIINLYDIRSLKVYLIKSSTPAFPDGGDPLSVTNLVSGPINININIGGPLNISKISFLNVNPSGSYYYHMAVQAYNNFNTTGTQLIRPNNGRGIPWTGTAANLGVAVSTGTGIQVDGSAVVSSVTPLSIPISLTSSSGAKANAILKSNNSIKNIKSYLINYCTNSSQPTATKVLGSDIVVNADESGIIGDLQKLQLSDLPAGNYYLTVKPFDTAGGIGTNILLNNNGGSAYADGSNQIAVSTNQVSISSELVPSFVPTTLDYVNVNVNIQ